MLISLLHLVALASTALPAERPASPSSSAAEVPVTEPVPVVVVHDGDLALRDRLIGLMSVWHDAGAFLVGEAGPEPLGWLARRGIETHRFACGEGWELFVHEYEGERTVRRVESLGGAIPFQRGQQVLIAMPPGCGSPLQGVVPERGARVPIADVPIRREAMAPRRPFVPPAGPGGSRSTPSAEPRIQAIVDAVDGSNVEATVASLSSIYSRRVNLSGAVTAQGQIQSQMQSYGLVTSLQDFGYLSKNVIGEIPGVGDPSKIIVIGAHYDSINLQGSSLPAPGADDNASGTGGVLEAARVLAANGPYRHTVHFIAFSGEELGLYGSSYAATRSDALGENILAMLNMDMIAYREPGDTRDVDLITNNTSPELNDFCDTMGSLYVPGWALQYTSLGWGSSDHASYNHHGFPATFFFEDVPGYCPYIHTSADTYPTSTNDFELAEMIVKGVVATAATLADPADILILHTPLQDTEAPGPYPIDCQITSSIGATIMGATLSYSLHGGAYTAVPMTHQGGDDWSAAIPDFGSPMSIRYTIEAFDDQGNTEVLPSGMDYTTPPFTFYVGAKRILYFNDFEGANDGWGSSHVSSIDDWQLGAPHGKAGDPASAFSGSHCWGNDLGAAGWDGYYPASTHNWLYTPCFDFTDEPLVILEYRRWLTVEQPLNDVAEIWIDGEEVWQNPAGGDHLDTAWTKHTLDISPWVAGKADLRIQFHLITNGSSQRGGWNIDDFSLYGLSNCPSPVSYCTANPNSQSDGAVIGHFGTARVAAKDLILTVEHGPMHQFGLFYYGPNQIAVPYGEGIRCVGGGVFRLPVIKLDLFGNGTWTLDYANPPDPAGEIHAGDVWNFQFWYRDPTGGPAGFNFSDGLEVTFCP